jgi:hypothetical protein
VGKHKVFTTGFAHNARVGFVFMDVGTNSLPDVLENLG